MGTVLRRAGEIWKKSLRFARQSAAGAKSRVSQRASEPSLHERPLCVVWAAARSIGHCARATIARERQISPGHSDALGPRWPDAKAPRWPPSYTQRECGKITHSFSPGDWLRPHESGRLEARATVGQFNANQFGPVATLTQTATHTHTHGHNYDALCVCVVTLFLPPPPRPMIWAPGARGGAASVCQKRGARPETSLNTA